MWQVLLPYFTPVIAALIGYGAKHAVGERRWTAIRKLALNMLADEKKPQVTTVDHAVIEALIAVQLSKLVEETNKVRRAFDLTANGVGRKATGSIPPPLRKKGD